MTSEPRASVSAEPPLLRVEGLGKTFRLGSGSHATELRAAHQVTFDVARGETLGLVGESGSGKSTVARCIMGLQSVSAGRVLFEREDLAGLDFKELQRVKSRMQIVFQDPFSSLDPRMSVRAIVEEPLKVHGYKDKKERDRLTIEALELVGIPVGDSGRKPSAFSGGQRQRIALARALVLRPQLLILDEPVTALDVSVQAQILNVLMDLREQLGLAYLFVVHDLAVAELFCDRVAVMYLGQIVEMADSTELFTSPLHPYTHALLSSVPIPDPKQSRRSRPAPAAVNTTEATGTTGPALGCPFRARCPVGRDRDICRTQPPELNELSGAHAVACHFPGELTASASDESKVRSPER